MGDIRHVASMDVEHDQEHCHQAPQSDKECRNQPGIDLYGSMHHQMCYTPLFAQ
jgi:hypothetical protein